MTKISKLRFLEGPLISTSTDFLYCLDCNSRNFMRWCHNSDLEGSFDLKIEIFKSCNFVGGKAAAVENKFRFALSFKGQFTFPRSLKCM